MTAGIRIIIIVKETGRPGLEIPNKPSKLVTVVATDRFEPLESFFGSLCSPLPR